MKTSNLEHNRYPDIEYRKLIDPYSGEVVIFKVTCCAQSEHHPHRILSIYNQDTNAFNNIPKMNWHYDSKQYENLIDIFDNEAEIISEAEVDLVMVYNN